MTRDFMNVAEVALLYDTVGVYQQAQSMQFTRPASWFDTLAQLGGQNEIDFFNMRSKAIGLPYNNQDKRDQLAWGMRVYSIGISFFSNSMTQVPEWTTDVTLRPEDVIGHIFSTDLPRHVGAVLRVQQDDRLKTTSYFCPAGYGPFGDGYGRGAPSTSTGNVNQNGFDHHLSVRTQGLPDLSNRWPFPMPLLIPRNATVSLKLRINEYGRQLLQRMSNLLETQGSESQNPFSMETLSTFFGIQVSLFGERLLQQRGEYHA